MQKACSHCKLVKDFADFGADPKMLTGRKSRCKKCVTEFQKAKYHSKSIEERRQDWKRNDKRPRLYNSSKNRTLALNNGDMKYHGKPCCKCGGTLRYTTSSTCSQCQGGNRRFKYAQPKWLTQDQLNEIGLLYKNSPEGYEVDHIIPLQGKNVCGLHVPWNLRLLPRRLNRLKGNKM